MRNPQTTTPIESLCDELYYELRLFIKSRSNRSLERMNELTKLLQEKGYKLTYYRRENILHVSLQVNVDFTLERDEITWGAAL